MAELQTRQFNPGPEIIFIQLHGVSPRPQRKLRFTIARECREAAIVGRVLACHLLPHFPTLLE